MLLTSKYTLPADTQSALRRINPDRVTVIGSQSRVSSAIDNQIARAVPKATVERVAGATSIDTAAAVSRKFFTSSRGAFVVNARNFPDAVAGAALAGPLRAPILLTNGKCLSASTVGELRRLRAGTLVAIGGAKVVRSSALVRQTRC